METMKKVLIVSSNSHSLLNFRRELVESFLGCNLSVVACAPIDENTKYLIEKFEKLNIKFEPFDIRNNSKNIFFDLFNIINFIKIIKSNKIDCIFSYHMKPVIYGSILASLLGLKHIYSMVTGLGYVFTENKSISISMTRALLKRLLSFSLLLNKKVFFQNKDDFELICTTKKLKNSSVMINGSGVNVDFFRFTDVPKALSFLFVGRLLIHKGINEYIEAAKILKKKYPDLSFKVAGGFHSNPSSISRTKLEKWIQEGIIDYLGDVHEMLPIFQNASVCVLPSYREGCPRSLLEAMAVGRAIITTDAPGCRDTVVENHNGYLVPIKNSTLLSEAMEKFIATPELVKAMGLKSRQLAEEKYDVHKVNKKILEGMGLSKAL
jgi:glycosyltransferase involved in cell wall biosynthesis